MAVLGALSRRFSGRRRSRGGKPVGFSRHLVTAIAFGLAFFFGPMHRAVVSLVAASRSMAVWHRHRIPIAFNSSGLACSKWAVANDRVVENYGVRHPLQIAGGEQHACD